MIKIVIHEDFEAEVKLCQKENILTDKIRDIISVLADTHFDKSINSRNINLSKEEKEKILSEIIEKTLSHIEKVPFDKNPELNLFAYFGQIIKGYIASVTLKYIKEKNGKK